MTLVVIFALMAAAPLWGPGIINTRGGGDSPFLIQRTLDLADNLAHGIFPPRWMAHAAYDLGYPFFNHYAALPYYISGGLTAVGINPLSAIQATQTAGFILAALAMHLWSRRIYQSHAARIIAVVAYTFAPFHLVNVYVRGDSLSEFYAFIWYLERGHRFYTVDHLEIDYRERDVKSPHWDWVHFKMLFRAYFEPRSRIEDLPPVQTSARPLAKLRNPFRPLITATLPENRLGLFEVDGARLKGLAHNLAYLVDRTGEASVLREGDRVFLGKLSKIDIDANRVEFVLNKGGIWERLRLHVEIETLQR